MRTWSCMPSQVFFDVEIGGEPAGEQASSGRVEHGSMHARFMHSRVRNKVTWTALMHALCRRAHRDGPVWQCRPQDC